MKSNKIFFISTMLFLFLIWIISLNLHQDLGHQSDKNIWIIQLFTAFLGIILMRITLGKEEFLPFFVVYISFNIFYYFFVLFALFIPNISVYKHVYHTIHISNKFAEYTFINTPLPFIFYWVFIKILHSAK